jgi:signal peptidase II
MTSEDTEAPAHEEKPSEGEAAPSEETQSSASGSHGPEEAAAAVAVEEPTAPTPEEAIAPGVERLAPPAFAAKRIADPSLGPGPAPSFLAAVSIISLVSDIGSKLWAEANLNPYKGGAPLELVKDRLTLMYAENKGGAWGLLQGTREDVRRPFFLLVSVAAIAFIVTLYRRLTPRQQALKWGLPLVLGGALGNVFDRIRYGFVVDFIDFQADAIHKGNEIIAKYNPSHQVTNHWPTFNVADIAICVGVGLMAVDMFTSKRGPKVRPLAQGDLASAVDAEIGTSPASSASPADEPKAEDAPATTAAHEAHEDQLHADAEPVAEPVAEKA